MGVVRALRLCAALACLLGAMSVVELALLDEAATDVTESAESSDDVRTDVHLEEDPHPVDIHVGAALFSRRHIQSFGASTGIGPRHGHLRTVHRPPEA